MLISSTKIMKRPIDDIYEIKWDIMLGSLSLYIFFTQFTTCIYTAVDVNTLICNLDQNYILRYIVWLRTVDIKVRSFNFKYEQSECSSIHGRTARIIMHLSSVVPPPWPLRFQFETQWINISRYNNMEKFTKNGTANIELTFHRHRWSHSVIH